MRGRYHVMGTTLAAVVVFAMASGPPVSAAPSVAPTHGHTEKCGKPKKNQDGSISNVLCSKGKANSQVRKYLAGQSSFVMQLGADATVADLYVAVCGDLEGVTYPIVLNAYTYVYAANQYKAPLPTVKALGRALVSDSNPLGCVSAGGGGG